MQPRLGGGEAASHGRFSPRSPTTRYRVLQYHNGRPNAVPASVASSAPVLFVPGNRGDYKQVRSLGAASETRGDGGRLVWYTVDFSEDAAALVDDQVRRQVAFIPPAIRGLHETHPSARRVVVVGHSSGASIALAATLAGNRPGELPRVAMVTVAAPLRRLALLPGPWALAVDALLRSHHDAAGSLPVLSISGGDSDTVVPPALAGSAQPKAGACHGPEVAADPSVVGARTGRAAWPALDSPSLPSVGFGADHLAVVWCKQLVASVAFAVAEIAQATTAAMPAQVAAAGKAALCDASTLGRLPPSPPARQSRTLQQLTEARDEAAEAEDRLSWRLAAAAAGVPSRFGGFAVGGFAAWAIVDLTSFARTGFPEDRGARFWAGGVALALVAALAAFLVREAATQAVDAVLWSSAGGLLGVASSPVAVVLAATDGLVLVADEGLVVAAAVLLAAAVVALGVGSFAGALFRAAGAGEASTAAGSAAAATLVCWVDLWAALVTRDWAAAVPLGLLLLAWALCIGGLAAGGRTAPSRLPSAAAVALALSSWLLLGRSVWLHRLLMIAVVWGAAVASWVQQDLPARPGSLTAAEEAEPDPGEDASNDGWRDMVEIAAVPASRRRAVRVE